MLTEKEKYWPLKPVVSQLTEVSFGDGMKCRAFPMSNGEVMRTIVIGKYVVRTSEMRGGE